MAVLAVFHTTRDTSPHAAATETPELSLAITGQSSLRRAIIGHLRRV